MTVFLGVRFHVQPFRFAYGHKTLPGNGFSAPQKASVHALELQRIAEKQGLLAYSLLDFAAMGNLSTRSVAFGALWLVAVAAGGFIIWNYESNRGAARPAPQQWPAGAAVALDPKLDTLLLFAHPHCPCTRATIGELNRLMAKCDGHVAAHVFFLNPEKLPAEWAQTDLWRSSAAIPGVAVHADQDGRQAALFGAETSGMVLLYNPQGRLLFDGGITASRGHAGDNAGEDAVVALLKGKPAGASRTPVFGCGLLDHCEMPSEGIAP